ncbi:MAG: hypothetical protein HZC28_06815 [Spirochaetes bacterium]|nr:hypothetical protein [Spirochaetota bacterium]
MRKGIVATLILFLASVAIILFSFSLSGRPSYAHGSSSMPFITNGSTDIEEDEDKVFIRHRIEPYSQSYGGSRRFMGKSIQLRDRNDLIETGNVKIKQRVSMSEDDVLIRKDETPYLFYGNADNTDTQKLDSKIKEAEIATRAEAVTEPPFSLTIDKESIYRYEPLSLYIGATGIKPAADELEIYVRRSGNKQLIANGDERYVISMLPSGNGYRAVYLHPFGGSIGEYEFVVYVDDKKAKRVYTKAFYVKGRAVTPLEKTMSVVSMEYNLPISEKKIPSPNGGAENYHAFYDWVRIMNADTFWVLAGQTTGWDSTISPQKSWGSIPIRNVELLAASPNKRDVKLGAYLMSYFTPGYGNQNAGYTVSLGYDRATQSVAISRHISLSCKKRLNDIIDLLRRFQDNRNISHLGLDFIRTGETDGFEMADEMVSRTGVRTPADWNNMAIEAKVIWLSGEVGRSKSMMMKWRWFRAHKTASIIHSIRDAGITKPIWVFTLGWNHGLEHGQDPYMFFDAGADMDAVMLYEANHYQYKQMMVHWPAYLNGNYNVLAGNMIDKRMLDGDELAQMEFYKRSTDAAAKMNRNNRVRGIFFHDISRALWSRYRGADINEWSYINAAVASRVKEKYNETPVSTKLELDEENGRGTLTVANLTGLPVENISIQTFAGPELKGIYLSRKEIPSLAANETLEVPFTFAWHEGSSGAKTMLGIRVILPRDQVSAVFVYTNTKRPRAMVMNTETQPALQ